MHARGERTTWLPRAYGSLGTVCRYPLPCRSLNQVRLNLLLTPSGPTHYVASYSVPNLRMLRLPWPLQVANKNDPNAAWAGAGLGTGPAPQDWGPFVPIGDSSGVSAAAAVAAINPAALMLRSKSSTGLQALLSPRFLNGGTSMRLRGGLPGGGGGSGGLDGEASGMLTAQASVARPPLTAHPSMRRDGGGGMDSGGGSMMVPGSAPATPRGGLGAAARRPGSTPRGRSGLAASPRRTPRGGGGGGGTPNGGGSLVPSGSVPYESLDEEVGHDMNGGDLDDYAIPEEEAVTRGGGRGGGSRGRGGRKAGGGLEDPLGDDDAANMVLLMRQGDGMASPMQRRRLVAQAQAVAAATHQGYVHGALSGGGGAGGGRIMNMVPDPTVPLPGSPGGAAGAALVATAAVARRHAPPQKWASERVERVGSVSAVMMGGTGSSGTGMVAASPDPRSPR